MKKSLELRCMTDRVKIMIGLSHGDILTVHPDRNLKPMASLGEICHQGTGAGFVIIGSFKLWVELDGLVVVLDGAGVLVQGGVA